jgi:hypothetical protein
MVGKGNDKTWYLLRLALLIQTAHRRAHALGAHGDDIVSGGEGCSDGVEVTQEESVAEAHDGAGLEGSEDLLVVLRLGSVRDEQYDEVGLLDDLIHLTEGSLLLTETYSASLIEGLGPWTETNGHSHTRRPKSIGEVLCLRRSLRSPSNDTDLLNTVSLEDVSTLRVQVSTTLDDILFGARHADSILLKELGIKIRRAIDTRRKYDENEDCMQQCE